MARTQLQPGPETGHYHATVGVDELPAGGPLLSATVTLTNAQIKALPTTPVEIVAAPGVGKALVALKAVCIADKSAGAYTLTGGDIHIAFSYADWLGLTMLGGGPFQEDLTKAWPLISTGDTEVVAETLGSVFPTGGDGSSLDRCEDQGIVVHALGEDASTVVTGGDPANTLKVTVLYAVVDV